MALVETMWLDTYRQTLSSGLLQRLLPTTRRETSKAVLETDATYVVKIKGTMSFWDSSAWETEIWPYPISLASKFLAPIPKVKVTKCSSAESSPLYSTSGRSNGMVGNDPEYRFASPDENCSTIPINEKLFSFSLDGNQSQIALEAIENEYNSEHEYSYKVVGQGHNFLISFSDDPYNDNYGKFKIELYREKGEEVALTVMQPQNGKVTGENLDCGTMCQANYEVNSAVTLTATPTENHQFSSWTGDCSGSEPTISVKMEQAKSCGATFVEVVCKTTRVPVDNPVNTRPPGLLGIIFDKMKKTPFTQEYRNVTTCEPVEEVSESCNDITDGLVACYSFNGNANDGSEYNNHGNVHGPILARDWLGNENSAYQFDGRNDQISISASNSIQPTDAITVSARINADNVQTWHQIISKRYSQYNNPWNSYALTTTAQGASNKWVFCLSNGTPSSQTCVADTSTLTATQWVYLTGTYNGKVMKLYVNGVLKSTKEKTGKIGYSSLPLRIGTTNIDKQYAKGQLDDIRIYNRALSGAEIQQLYQLGNAPEKVTLTITQPQNGKVTGENLDCGATCSTDYEINSTTTLTATPDDGYQFVDWTGDCSGSVGTIDVTMDQAKTCTANFTQTVTPDKTFNFDKDGFGISKIKPKAEAAWTIDCRADCSQANHDFTLGTELLLTASPMVGSEFTGWQCDNGLTSDKARWSFTLDTPTTCTVTFALIEDDPNFRKLTVQSIGTGNGQIIVSNVNLGEQGEMNFKVGRTARLTAEPNNALYTFKGWSGDCSSTKAIIKLKMNDNKICYAEFESDLSQISGEVVVQLYQNDAFTSQYPQAENSECLQEAMTFAMIPMQLIASHFQVKGTWPTQLNSIELYTPPPVTVCTQSVKMIDGEQGNNLQIQVYLINSSGQTELVNLHTAPSDANEELTNWPWSW